MPLTARLNGTRLISVDLTPEAFEALRGEAGLQMTCCEAGARVKRSVRGLPFFAHAARGACEYAGESDLHVHAKAEVLRAAREAGWAADVEVRGHTPGGQAWRADVLCERGRSRVAFEVQRSGVTLADLHARQATYRQSGVRGLWLMRTRERDLQRAQPWQADTPALYLTEARTVPALGLTLPEFVHAALGGHLTLFPARERAVDLDVQQEPARCPACTRTHYRVRAVRVRVPASPDVQVVIPGTQGGVGEWLSAAQWWPDRFVTWPTGRTRLYRCPTCGLFLSASRFQPKWLKADDGAARFSVGRRGVYLTAAQHDWVVQSAGQVWTYWSLLDP
ncbi:competence protein CoiA family protein [Deinococcus soli (ex Cha et al. 2016)]|uniref:competence protein CoiA family protein n=1 Tax=Deinococcus soli (ex Cha et al. 2016) TaxID=1309411 RepID=UPI001665D20A|nr:competence protein CoiA family protein [Deinococcus soli (ex Cha et al. 2016)]GGB82632.1 hypothetical protein GCM10008019_43490 [Deinococcus soli (ex Cha et al. 2016)]